MKLWAPKSYWTASRDAIESVTGGCGPGGIGDHLVPDTIYGLSVRPACEIHDWMYFVGETLENKIQADRVFLNNMVRLIDAGAGCGVLKHMRRLRARTYYLAVKHFGGPFFWADKNVPAEFREIHV
jgi:hypothetical protein